MVRYGASAGFVGDGLEGIIANNMFIIAVDDSIREYVKLYLRSPQIFTLLNHSGGSSAMPALNFKTISTLRISLPTLQEQREILNVIDLPLKFEQQSRDLAESVIAQIDGMKKAILARAFRGELGTNDPSEAACEG